MSVFFSPYSDIILSLMSIALVLAGISCIELSREKETVRVTPAWRMLGIALLVLAIREWIGIITISAPDVVDLYPLGAILQTASSALFLLAAREEARGRRLATAVVNTALIAVFFLTVVSLLPALKPHQPQQLASAAAPAAHFHMAKVVMLVSALIMAICGWRNAAPGVRSVLSTLVFLSALIVASRTLGRPQLALGAPEPPEWMIGIFILRVLAGFAAAAMLWGIYTRALGVSGKMRWWPLVFLFLSSALFLGLVHFRSKDHVKLVESTLRGMARDAGLTIPGPVLSRTASLRGSANNPLVAEKIFGTARRLSHSVGATPIATETDAFARLAGERRFVPVIDVVNQPRADHWANDERLIEDMWRTVSDGTSIYMRRDHRSTRPVLLAAPIPGPAGSTPLGAAVLTVSSPDLAQELFLFRRMFLLLSAPLFFVLLLLVSGLQRTWLTSHSSSRSQALRLGALSSNLAAIVIVREGNVVDVNPRACELFGIAREDAVGHSVDQLLESASPGLAQTARALLETSPDRSVSLQTEIFRPDGDVVHIMLFGRPLSPEDDPLLSIWEAIDITGLKEVKAELRRSRDHLQMILDTMTTGVFVKDHEDRFIAMNSACATLLHLPLENSIGKTVSELLPENAEESRNNDEICVDMAGATLVYDQVFTFGGEKRHFQMSKTMRWVDREKEHYVIVGSVHEFTERKRAQEAIEADRHFLLQLIDSLPLSLCFVDRDRIIRLCDRDFCREAGLDDPGEAVGKPFDEVSPYGPMTADDDLRVLSRKRGYTDIEFEMRKDGKTRFFNLRRSVMHSADGETIGIIKAFWDTTALAAANRAAKSASRAKAAFLANMSHELRTPMNGIIGMADLIMDHEKTQPVLGLYAETIIKSTKTLQMVMDEIMDVAANDGLSEQVAIHATPFPLLSLTEEAAQIVSCLVEAWGVELFLSYDFALRSIYTGDPRRIRQVMVQILTHCSRLTIDKRIRLEVASTGPEDDGRLVVRTVFQPLPGTSATLIEHRFKEQPGHDDALAFMNLGMFNERIGLPLAWRLIERMGGSLAVREGDGSITVEVMLPLASDGTFPSSAQLNAPDLSSVSVLVATADEERAGAVLSCLEYADARVSRAGTREAVEEAMKAGECSGRPFHLLILDTNLVPPEDLASFAVKLPGMADPDGPELMLVVTAQQVPSLGDIGVQVHNLLMPPLCPSELWYKIAELARDGGPNAPSRRRTTRILRAQRMEAKVLLVEDNTVNQMVALGILKRIGCTAVLARNGLEAVAMIEGGEDFDLILMDCMMPVMDGYEATGRIRMLERDRRDARRHTIIALTANAMAGDRERCLAAGMDDYITKPVTLELIREAILRNRPDLAAEWDSPE